MPACTCVTRWSSPLAPQRVTWVWHRSRHTWDAGCLPVRPAMAPSIAASRYWWSAAATPRWKEALYLSNIAAQVTLIHRRDQLRAEKQLAGRLLHKAQQGNVRILWNRVLDEVLGDEQGVTGARIRDPHSNATEELALSGVFIAIGHDPNTGLFRGSLDMDEHGYLHTGRDARQATATSIPGVFAAGDVADPVYRQAITAAGMGCMAALGRRGLAGDATRLRITSCRRPSAALSPNPWRCRSDAPVLSPSDG